MKSLTNINAQSIREAVVAAQQARDAGQSVAFSGGGTDLLQQIKDGTDLADVVINLRNVDGGGNDGLDRGKCHCESHHFAGGFPCRSPGGCNRSGDCAV